MSQATKYIIAKRLCKVTILFEPEKAAMVTLGTWFFAKNPLNIESLSRRGAQP